MKLQEIIRKNNFKFQKRFGQNFISDKELLDGIVEKAEIGANDVVVEIGVGGATLTRAISERAKYVYGYEIDKNLEPVIAESLKGVENAEVIFKDFMRERLDELEKRIGESYSIVANLPYYITTPIIMRIIEESKLCKKIVIMVQEEVALRLCAKENTPDYGAITVAVDAVANAKIVERVGREMFFPSPNVDSAVVRIDIDRNKFNIKNHLALRAAVRTAFASRRKTLANNLINDFKISRSDAESILSECEIDLSARGETLSTERFIALGDALNSRNLIK